MALLGTYNHTLDHKVFIYISFEGCIDVRNGVKLLKWTKKVALTRQAADEGIAFTQKITSMYDETTFGNAGRIKISSVLQNKANITKDVVIIVNNDHLELWDSKVWEVYIEQAPVIEEASKNFEEKN